MTERSEPEQLERQTRKSNIQHKDEKAESVYEMYYNFEEPISKMAGHRVLAINRGENEKVLSIKVTAPVEKIIAYLEKKVIVRDNIYTNDILKDVVEDSYQRLIAPAIEREIRNDLTENAENGAIKVFGDRKSVV